MHLRRVSFLKTTDNAVKMTNKLSLRKQKEFRSAKTSVNRRSFKKMNLGRVPLGRLYMLPYASFWIRPVNKGLI